MLNVTNLKKIIEESKLYVSKDKYVEWENFCYKLYKKDQLREVAIEIIEDSIKSMKLLSERNYKLDEIIKEVGRSWDGGISHYLLELIIDKFFADKELFEKAIEEMQQNKPRSRNLDGVMKKIK